MHENSMNTSAGVSRRGRVRTMSRKMADSVSQWEFFGNSQCTTWHHKLLSRVCTEEDLFHDAHLELQERMSNPVALHAEMMGDIMYLHQALKQRDASQFVDAVVREINGHVENNH